MTSIDTKALAQSLRRLQSPSSGNTVLLDSLRRVVDACTQLFEIDGCGLMLADDQDALRYVVATDGPGRALEQAQTETGQGPCARAFVLDQLIATHDVADDDRWPLTARLMVGRGVGAVLGVPVRLSGLPVGTLDVYRAGRSTWDESEQEALARYGEVVEVMLATAVSAEQAGELANQLNYALEYRIPIERGVGYLMARDGLGQPAAFELLRSAARSSRRKIGDVAQELLGTGRLPGEGA